MTTVPQLALQLIGPHRITAKQKFTDGYSSGAWRVGTEDGETYIVKKCANQWCASNERRAIAFQRENGLAAPELFRHAGRLLIFHDTGATTPRRLCEAAVRQCGAHLRSLHDGRSDLFPAETPEVDTLMNTISQSARTAGYCAVAPVPTHGDLTPTNMLTFGGGEVFCHLIDYEEFWPGDPLADLMVGALEFAGHKPEQARCVVRWLIGGYFDGRPLDERSALWGDTEQRAILGNAAHTALTHWAEQNGKLDLVSHYRDTRDVALDAIASH